MSKSYFSDIGILGWKKIEPIILAAMLSNKSVLLLGPHGATKTEGCRLISQAVFGGTTKFVPYDTSLVNADDLLGYLHPKKLAEGDVAYISTPDSIWDATSCLLDEINRCNPYNAAKFFEIVRSRTINGRDTELQFVWAACNPPDKYNTAHMDIAQVSRFLVLEVPTYHDLSPSERKAILHIEDEGGKPNEIKDLMDRARGLKIPAAQAKAIEAKVLKLAESLNKTKDIEFSGRQVSDLHKLFCNMDRISQVFENLDIGEKILCTAVLSLVPEVSGLTRAGNVMRSKLEGEIATILQGFKLSDPVLTATNVVELCQAKIKDSSGHAAAIGDMLQDEQDQGLIDKAWTTLTARNDIPPDMFDTLRQTFAVRAATIKLHKRAKVEDAAAILTQALQQYGPKAPRKGRKAKKARS
jgi:MoxR-like ATPase